MISISPSEIPAMQLQAYLQGAVSPRPIALASTIAPDGTPNLSPFSFFNVFSSNPPIVVFSPARRVRDNTTKHTLQNAHSTKEVVINVVTYDMVQQTSLSSTEYADGVNEFEKAGFTMLASEVVQPFRVAESPVQLECKITDIIALGTEGGAGNMVICEVVKIHINERILDEKGTIDQDKIDLVSRMGGNWYSRANKGLFEVEKPLTTLGIGVDALPKFIKESPLLSGNHLGQLGNVQALPQPEERILFWKENTALATSLANKNDAEKQQLAIEYLNKNEIQTAWHILLAQ